MKSKTKVLFLTLSVVLLVLSVFTIKLYLSQNEMKKSLAESSITVDGQMNYNDASDVENHVVRTSYVPSENGDNFVDAAAKTVNTVVHIRTEIVTKSRSIYRKFFRGGGTSTGDKKKQE